MCMCHGGMESVPPAWIMFTDFRCTTDVWNSFPQHKVYLNRIWHSCLFVHQFPDDYFSMHDPSTPGVAWDPHMLPRHGRPNGGWVPTAARLQSVTLLGVTPRKWVFWIWAGWWVGTTIRRSTKPTEQLKQLSRMVAKSPSRETKSSWKSPSTLVVNTLFCC